MTDTTTIYLLLPEIVLLVAATAIYLAGAFFPRHFWPHAAAAGAIVLAGVLLGWQDCHTHAEMLSSPRAWLSGPLVMDLIGQICLWATLLFGLLLVMLSADSPSVRPAAEYVGSLLLIVAGLMFVAVGYDLVLLFVGLELISIPTYIVLYLGRRDPFGQEATVKYFFLSILSSALLLYGFSFLYGIAGSTRLDVLREALLAGGNSPGIALAPIGVLLVFAGMGFRMSCVPLQFYAPDVYQGTNNANAGLLSTLPKIAGLLVLVRIVYASMPGLGTLGWKVAFVMAVATMTVGNLVALWQTDIRRLLAYSSIAHGGYILIGVAAGLAHAESYTGQEMTGFRQHGVGAAFFYLGVYCLATIGAFAAVKYLGGRERQVDSLDELAGLGRSRPLPALALAVSMFSLAGIPPLAGFWGKLTLFASALGVGSTPGSGAAPPLRAWFVGLAIIGVLNAAVAMAYYLRVVGVMYFRPGAAPESSTIRAEGGIGAWWAMVACTLLVIGVGVYPGPFMSVTDRAAQSIRQSEPIEVNRTTGSTAAARSFAARSFAARSFAATVE